MTNTLVIVLSLANCALYFAIGRMWQYRAECRRAGNL